MQSQIEIKRDLDRAIEVAKKYFNRPGVSKSLVKDNPSFFPTLQEFTKNNFELFNIADENKDGFISQEEADKLAKYAYGEDDLFVEDIKKYSNRKPQTYKFELIKVISVPNAFSDDVVSAVESVPLKLRDFVFNSKEVKPFNITLWNELLSDVYPDHEDLFKYASGITNRNDREIDISTKVRRKKDDEVIDYRFPKNITYHEIGHALDDQLLSRYLKPIFAFYPFFIQEGDSKYDSYSTSKAFKEAYDEDLKKLKEKIENGEISESDGKRILDSYYIQGSHLTDGEKMETFAEIFCMLMIKKTNDNEALEDFKRFKDFLDYFPRCRKVVEDAIKIFDPGF